MPTTPTPDAHPVLDLHHRLIPAVPVVFDRAGRLVTEANRRYAEWLAWQRVGGVAVWAHTGRGLHLTDEQRDEVLALWRRAAPEVPAICGVGVPAGTGLPAAAGARTDAVVAATVGMAEAARRGGAAAVMVHPPSALTALGGVTGRVVALHAAVAEVGLPVLAFHLYEAASGLAYHSDLVARLLAVPGVAGIKLATLDSVMTFQDLVPVVRQFPRASLVTGEDRFLGYSLMLGADAALVGIGAACTDVSVDLLARWFAREPEAFLFASRVVDTFGRAIFRPPMEGYVQRLLWALEADGVLEGGACDPYGPALPGGERERVAAVVGKLRRP